MTPLIVPGLYRSHVLCAWPMWIGAPTSMGPRKSARARVRVGADSFKRVLGSRPAISSWVRRLAEYRVNTQSSHQRPREGHHHHAPTDARLDDGDGAVRGRDSKCEIAALRVHRYGTLGRTSRRERPLPKAEPIPFICESLNRISVTDLREPAEPRAEPRAEPHPGIPHSGLDDLTAHGVPASAR